jgi:hypothetical protein
MALPINTPIEDTENQQPDLAVQLANIQMRAVALSDAVPMVDVINDKLHQLFDAGADPAAIEIVQDKLFGILDMAENLDKSFKSTLEVAHAACSQRSAFAKRLAEIKSDIENINQDNPLIADLVESVEEMINEDSLWEGSGGMCCFDCFDDAVGGLIYSNTDLNMEEANALSEVLRSAVEDENGDIVPVEMSTLPDAMWDELRDWITRASRLYHAAVNESYDED